jgi:THAP domain
LHHGNYGLVFGIIDGNKWPQKWKWHISFYQSCCNYRFPKDSEIRQQWLFIIISNNLARGGEIREESKICSQHFRKDDYVLKHGRRILKDYAIPTIFPDITIPVTTVSSKSSEAKSYFFSNFFSISSRSGFQMKFSQIQKKFVLVYIGYRITSI